MVGKSGMAGKSELTGRGAAKAKGRAARRTEDFMLKASGLGLWILL
jgi:hypothetical protein